MNYGSLIDDGVKAERGRGTMSVCVWENLMDGWMCDVRVTVRKMMGSVISGLSMTSRDKDGLRI